MISRVKRIMHGIDGADREANIETIQETGYGGNYLMHETTLNRCRIRWRAQLPYCGGYNDWEYEGARDIVQRANQACKKILAAAPDSMIDPALEDELEAYIKSGSEYGMSFILTPIKILICYNYNYPYKKVDYENYTNDP